MTRPEYEAEDHQEREAYIRSRTQVLNKTYATAIWMKVIHRAVDDIVLYETMLENKPSIKEEDMEDLESAKSFLFNDEHLIPFDDYIVIIICQECGTEAKLLMSEFAAEDYICKQCNTLCNPVLTEYYISSEQAIREISLKELLSLWGIENINAFRKGTIRRIEELKAKKRLALKNKRNKNK
jgi:hypothetical protein